MKVGKWNYETHQYDDYELPFGAMTYIEDLESFIRCASCGELVKAGDCFTSMEIHTNAGFGYMVCENCYHKEWERRQDNERKK